MEKPVSKITGDMVKSLRSRGNEHEIMVEIPNEKMCFELGDVITFVWDSTSVAIHTSFEKYKVVSIMEDKPVNKKAEDMIFPDYTLRLKPYTEGE
jgi:hypothetical protein